MALANLPGMRTTVALIVMCHAFSSLAFAAEDEVGAWAGFATTDSFGSSATGPRWHYWFDTQARYFDIGSGINTWLVRPAVGYEFANGKKFWVGYAHYRARSRSGDVADENRYWQQFDWSNRPGDRGRFAFRARLEQRSVSIGDELGHRLRLRALYSFAASADKRTNWIFSIEPFFGLNATDWGGDSGLRQNRTFLGIGWRIGKRLALEAGYMNQYVWLDTSEDRSNHLGVINFRLLH